jgi:hypothetical protein
MGMSRTEQLQRPDPLTPDRWRRLPWLLPRAVVREWTGLSDREVEAQIRAGRLTTYKAGAMKRKFFKVEVAALIRIPAATTQTDADACAFVPMASVGVELACQRSAGAAGGVV